MLRRALKHAALAATLLTPTIAGVIAQAPAAHAYSTVALGTAKGSASIFINQSDTNQQQAAAFVPAAGSDCKTSWDNGSASPFVYSPGASVTVCLFGYNGWEYDYGFTQTGVWNSTTLTVRDFNGSTNLGTASAAVLTPVTATQTESCVHTSCAGGDWYAYFKPVTVTMSDNPLGTGTARPGSYELYVTGNFTDQLTSPATTYTADSRGASAGAPSEPGFPTYPQLEWGQGFVDAPVNGGLMAGEDPSTNLTVNKPSAETQLETDSTYVGKNMPITRVFPSNGNWGAPPSSISSMAANGRLVIFSFSPKNYTPTTGHSAWYDIANGTLDSSLTTWLGTLNTYATASGAPHEMLVTISHEPHDNATDWPTEGTNNNCTVDTQSCFGSVREFRSMLTHLHDLIHTLGYDSVLKTIYIATDSAATTHGNDGVSGGSDVIGGGDTMYPGNTHRTCHLTGSTPDCLASNVDYVGYDVYNYYQYWANHSPTYHDGTWEPLHDKLLVDDHAHGEGVALVADRLQKQFFIPELGSHPGCLTGDTEEGCNLSGITLSNETRDAWFSEGVTSIEQSATVMKWLRGWSYYHKLDAWDWRFMQDANQLSGTLDTFHQRGTSGWQNSVANNALFSSTALGI